MPIRLIRLTALPHTLQRHTTPRRGPVRIRMRTLAQIRTRDPLVRIRRLLDLDSLVLTVVAAAAGTATHAEEPEDGRAPGESHGEPGRHVHVIAKGAVDVVGFEDGVEGGC